MAFFNEVSGTIGDVGCKELADLFANQIKQLIQIQLSVNGLAAPTNNGQFVKALASFF